MVVAIAVAISMVYSAVGSRIVGQTTEFVIVVPPDGKVVDPVVAGCRQAIKWGILQNFQSQCVDRSVLVLDSVANRKAGSCLMKAAVIL
jgi:hypothetical protein